MYRGYHTAYQNFETLEPIERPTPVCTGSFVTNYRPVSSVDRFGGHTLRRWYQ